jgi:hypothetical protein
MRPSRKPQHENQLVVLQLGDEWDLNTESVRTSLVNWFNAVQAAWPNTILFHNNWQGQVLDPQLSDFIARAQRSAVSGASP